MLVEFLGDRDVGVGQTPSGLATTTGHGLGAANAMDLRGLAAEGLGLEVGRKLLAREAYTAAPAGEAVADPGRRPPNPAATTAARGGRCTVWGYFCLS